MRTVAFAFVAAALATFAAAAPAPNGVGSVIPVGDVDALVNGAVNDVTISQGGVLPRGSPASIATNYGALVADIQADIDLLAGLSTDDCTSGHVTPIVADIQVKIEAIISKIKLLVDVDVNVILAGDNGDVLTVDAVAQIVAADVVTLVVALDDVLARVDVSVQADIKACLDLDAVVAELLSTTCGLVDGLLTVVVGLLASINVDLKALAWVQVLALIQ